MPDPLIQRQVLRALQAFWHDGANNPAGMVDVARIYNWTWDARPYPAFPARTDVWADGPNHRNGHWLTGRLGGMASDELAKAVAADHGVALSAEPAAPFIGGYILGHPTTGRAALEPVIEATGLSLRNRSDGLHLGVARRGEATTIATDDLAEGEGPLLSRRRGDPAEAPGRLALSYQDRERDYLNGTVTALSRADGPLAVEGVALTLDGSGARRAAERMLDARVARRETLEITLPPAQLALEPGDVIDIAGLAEGPFEIGEIRDGLARRTTARTLPSGMAVATGIDRPLAAAPGVTVRSMPVVAAAHLPPPPADPLRSRLLIAAYAQPWPGPMQLADEVTGAGLTELSRRAFMGSTQTALPVGPTGVWDLGNAFEVSLLAGHPAAADPLAVLAGSNRLAIETDAGNWEVIGFAQADLLAPGHYRLSRLLRGLEGTGPAMGTVSAGNRVLVPDSRAASLPVEARWLGEARTLRVYAGSGDIEGTSVAVAASLAPALPLPPVHLRARREADDVVISWTRCSRADGDGWGALESPLDHAPERYRLTIMDGSTAVRVLDSGASPLIYAAADQVSDFGALPAGFSFSVAQLSPVLGAGHTAWGDYDG